MDAMRWAALVFALATAPGDAIGRDWLDFDRHVARTRIIRALDELGAAIPLPELTCGASSNLRYCRGSVRPGLTFNVAETFRSEREIAAFMAGGPGGFYDAMATATSRETIADLDDLCPAIILGIGVRRSPTAAREMFRTALRRAINRAGGGMGETTIVGNPTTLIVTVHLHDSVSCRVTAEDDYRAR